MEGLEKHLTERTMTAEEYLKTWETAGGLELVLKKDALEAIRLSKIDSLKDVVKEVENLTGETYSTIYRNEVVNILKSKLSELKNGK